MTGGNNPKPASYDLHLHTCWSHDATVEPELYFKRAEALGLRCLSFAEHHNIDSLGEALALAERFPDIEFIPAAELSVSASLCQVDLLCYNFPLKPRGELADVMEKYHRWQQQAGRLVSEGMRKLGYPYGEEDRARLLEGYRPERTLAKQGPTRVMGSVERNHFLEKGYISGAPEEYARILSKAGLPPYPPAEEVVPAIKNAGCLVVIAHPPPYFNEDDIGRMDILREECMLDGIECAHRKIVPELTRFYRKYCLEHGLVSTGGSDSHHMADIVSTSSEWGYTPERRFACHIGEDEWLDEFLERAERD